MAPLKQLNPYAQEWKPESPRNDISSFRSTKQQICHAGPGSFHLPVQKKQQQLLPQDSCNTSKTLVYCYYTTPSSQVMYYHRCFPLFPPIQQKDEIFLKEGEQAIKKVLKIDHHLEEEKLESSRSCRRLLQLPPRLRNSCAWVDRVGQKNNNTKKFVSKKWRAKKVKSESKVDTTFSSPPAAPDFLKHKTTVMIKNIPNQYRKESLMKFLDPYCLEHELEYDFFYLPMDFRSHDNLGFAFVNFTTAAAALKAKEILNGYKWGVFQIPNDSTFTSKKICDLTWAKIQGKDALVEHFNKSCFTCKNDDYLPVVLSPPRNGANGFSLKMSILGKMQGQF